MRAPSPELCNLWLARAFNAHDVAATSAMYHPDATIVRVDDVQHQTTRGVQDTREPWPHASTCSRTWMW